jgi:exopolyphosphatase/guanosine-5'-triphosphate,3'-diphosphate pyrophosphatase
LCAVALGLKTYDYSAVHGHELSLAEVNRTIAKFAALPLSERRHLPGMVEGRADVIIAGGLILERIMAAVDAKSVTVSDQGVRWGLIYREIGGQ